MRTSNISEPKQLMELKITLINLQEFAQVMLLKEARERNCIHDGDFCLCDAECWGCDIGKECLYIIAKFDERGKANNIKRLVECINISREYVLRKVNNSNHDPYTCFCDACKWLRETESTLSLFNNNH